MDSTGKSREEGGEEGHRKERRDQSETFTRQAASLQPSCGPRPRTKMVIAQQGAAFAVPSTEFSLLGSSRAQVTVAVRPLFWAFQHVNTSVKHESSWVY